jgi:DNA-binding response OmpR family regulator
LGLYIAKSIVARHGGSIDARSGSGPHTGRGEAPVHGRLVKILVVDDDRELRELIAFVLRGAGHAIVEAGDGLEAVRRHADERPDLVILDVNLPGIDGFEVCRRIRADFDTPVMMLTVRGEEADQVKGLDLGADDYLSKPFSPRTLSARVRALLRRGGSERPVQLSVGAIVLDPELQTVSVGGAAPVRLTKLEFRLLQLMIGAPNRTVPPERLMRHVWGQRSSAIASS